MMALTEDLVAGAAQQVLGSTKVRTVESRSEAGGGRCHPRLLSVVPPPTWRGCNREYDCHYPPPPPPPPPPQITYQGVAIDLTPPWRRATMAELVEEKVRRLALLSVELSPASCPFN